MDDAWQLDLGANLVSDGVLFNLWAPYHMTVRVEIEGKGAFPMEKNVDGYFSICLKEANEGDRYTYVLSNGLRRPDPVSRLLPDGLHGPSQVVDSVFNWTDGSWNGRKLSDCIFYELHVGSFTPQGTFQGVIQKLDYLVELGINCIELMPVAEFPGRWNWGYDGASLYAPYSGYGGVLGLKELVNEAHKRGIAVCLDVVYNHFGPEGSYLGEFGPYFSGRYHTPWGKGLNYDGAYSDHVRHLIVQNALYWAHEYHIDFLRLDAIHGIYDFSATPLLFQLKEALVNCGRPMQLVAESDLNDANHLRSHEEGGMGLDALWNDDFHHAAHVFLTGERHSYYEDYLGIADTAKAIAQGFVYDRKYSQFRKKTHGSKATNISPQQLVVFMQNHDQVGNRPMGERLGAILSPKREKIAALMTLFTPAIPMLFMGEEYGERRPFEYFVDYTNEKLMKQVYEGRKREFHRTDMPFPGKEAFLRSQLSWEIEESLLEFYQTLIQLRKRFPPKNTRPLVYFSEEKQWLAWEFQAQNEQWLKVLCFLGSKNGLISSPFTHEIEEILLATDHGSKLKQKQFHMVPDSALVLL